MKRELKRIKRTALQLPHPVVCSGRPRNKRHFLLLSTCMICALTWALYRTITLHWTTVSQYTPSCIARNFGISCYVFLHCYISFLASVTSVTPRLDTPEGVRIRNILASCWKKETVVLWTSSLIHINLRGLSVVKNVYVYRVITLRNDCIFSFLWWVVFFLIN